MGAFIRRRGRGRTPAMQQTFRNEYQFLEVSSQKTKQSFSVYRIVLTEAVGGWGTH